MKRRVVSARTSSSTRLIGRGGWAFFTIAALATCLLVALPAIAQPGADGSVSAERARPVVQSADSTGSGARAAAGQVIVTFKTGVSKSRALQVTAGKGASVQEVLPLASEVGGRQTAVVRSKTQSAQQLLESFRNDPSVAMVSLNYLRSTTETVVPNDDDFGQLWGLDNQGDYGGTADADIDAPEAWWTNTGDASVVIADIDTGADYRHEDLADNMWTNGAEIAGTDGEDDDNNGYVDDYYGIDTYNGDSDPMDDNGHGTHTAGIMAAVGDNETGVTGVSWAAKVMALKFTDADGAGYDAAAVEAIYYAIDQKLNAAVNVVAINASWGSGDYNAVLEEAIAAAGEAGIVFVAAAGGYLIGDDNDAMPFYPACYDLPNILSVGATEHNDYAAGFSNYGAESVDLFAPGAGIWSTLPASGFEPSEDDYFFDDMEDGPGNWTVEGNAPWAITPEQTPTGGGNSWSDSPNGVYGDLLDGSVVSRIIDLTDPAAPEEPVLAFSAFYNLEYEYDYLYVEFSADDGANWDTVATFTGEIGTWEPVSIPISQQFVTSEFRMRFRLVSDEFWEGSSIYDGVYIDDIGIGSLAGMSGYGLKSGTSMAAPYVAGAIAVLASEYPGDGALSLVNRVRCGVDVLDDLEGMANTEGRLNLAKSIDAGLNLYPWVVELTPRSGVGPATTLTLNGASFGSTPGRIILTDGVTEVDALVTSWSDTHVEAVMPDTLFGTVILEAAGGSRAEAGTVSAWLDREPSLIGRDGNAAATFRGRIYSFGGYTAGGLEATNLAEYYDIASDAWTMNSKQRLPGPRVYAAAAELDGLIYVIGGYDDTSDVVFDTVYAFDLVAQHWDSLADLPVPLYWHEAVALDGKIYVFGGMDDTDVIDPNMYVYDPDADSWETTLGPSTPRYECAGVALDGLIYAFGGDSDVGYQDTSEVYDPATDSWEVLSTMPFPLARMAVAEYGGLIYLLGGTNMDWFDDRTNTVLRYDPVADEFVDLTSTIQALPGEGFISSAAVAVPGKGIYSLNGLDSTGSSNGVRLLPDHITATQTIYGRVLDVDDEPVAGATVQVLLDSVEMGTAQTDASGDYRIDASSLQLGDVVNVAAAAPGYFAVTQKGTYDEVREEVSFFDFRDAGNDQDDRRLPTDDGGTPPTPIFFGLMPEPLTVTAAAGDNGAVDPSTQEVRYGEDAAIDITPDAGFYVERITVDGLPVPVADPFVLSDVRVSHDVEVTFSDAQNSVAVGEGWNLIAGTAGSDAHGVTLFAYNGVYYSLPAAMLEAGSGYWGRFLSDDTLSLNCSGMPILVHLVPGWNLIGNSGSQPAALPIGLLAFVFVNDAYTSTGVLEPGQGAWVKVTVEQDIVLTPM